MKIRRLVVERFRGLERLELHPGLYTVLIGPNNSGKSTVLEALHLLLGSGGRSRPALSELDYFGRDPAPGFTVEAVLGDLPAELRRDAVDHLEGWHPDDRRVIAQPDGPGVECALRVQATGSPDLDLQHSFAKPESLGAPFGRGLRRRVGWFFDGRSQDPARELAFNQGGVLEQLFDDVDLSQAIAALRAALSDGVSKVNTDPAVDPVLRRLGEDLHRLGLLPDQVHPQFEAGQVSPRQLLQALSLALPEPSGVPIPVDRQGRGAQRLLLIALLGRLAQAWHQAPIAAFVNPEQALVPVRQAQVVDLLRRLGEAGGQLFLETASPDIVRGFTLDDLVLLPASRAQPPRPLAELTPPAKQGYERRLDGPVVRALFAPAPLLVEGPADRPVLETFWDALTRSEGLASRNLLGVDVINCEGAEKQPQMAALLHEAGKTVLVWAEQDVPKNLHRLRTDGHCVGLLLHDPRIGRQNLEQSLAVSAALDGLAAGLRVIAEDRGYSWDDQLTELKAHSSSVDAQGRTAAAAATSIRGYLDAVGEEQARALVARVLSAKGVTPFELKGARQARLFAETVVTTAGVPQSYAVALRALVAWLQQGSPARPDGAPVEFQLTAQ